MTKTVADVLIEGITYWGANKVGSVAAIGFKINSSCSTDSFINQGLTHDTQLLAL